MGRPATGHLRENRSKTGRITSWALQYTYAGRRRQLTLPAATRDQAVREMASIMEDVRAGTWVPPRRRRPGRPRGDAPTFEQFAGSWVARQRDEGGRKQLGLSVAGKADLQWRLEHLLGHFAGMRLDQITVADVDAFRIAKVREDRLGTTSINKMLDTLTTIFETAVEHELLLRNPAKGRKRRLPAVTPHRTWIDRAEHITALLDAAEDLDRHARAAVGLRRPMLATLTFAGLRLGELRTLRWYDVDLDRGIIRVREAKTDAGVRIVHMLPILRRELTTYRNQLQPKLNHHVFATSSGAAIGPSNIRIRILARAVKQANAALEAEGREPLPDGLTPHSLRRTFASLLFALGEPPTYVMSQMGHTTPALTLALYAREMNRRDGERERLKSLAAQSPMRAASSSRSSTTSGFQLRLTRHHGTELGTTLRA